MKISWNEIIEKSWHHIRKHRFLWGLGVLAALTEGGAGFSSYPSSGGSGWETDSSQEISKAIDTASVWVTSHIDLIIIGLAAIFVIFLIILYISYSARAGLIYAVNALESVLPAEATPQALQAGDKKLSFSEAFDTGQKYFWPLFGLTLLVALLIFLAIAVFIGLVFGFIVLAIISLWFLIAVIPLGLITIFALAAFCFYLNLILLIASRELVITEHGVIASFRAGHELIRKNLGQVLLGWLINLGLSLAAGLIVALVLMIVGGALFLIGVGVYFIGKWTGVIIYAVPVGLALLALMLIISGIINAYFSTYWTLVYTKLKG